jgi:hypothetical protein
MFRKLNTKFMLIVLLVLTGIIALVYFIDKKKGEGTFKDEIARIDTGKVTSISVFPQSDNHKEIKLVKSGKIWKAQREKLSVEADSNDVKNLLNIFAVVRPERLAATEKSKWKDFSVDDSLGTRLKFYSGENVLLDIVVGKFSFNNFTRQGISYLRLTGSDEVYAVNGFIPMEVNQPFNQWRNGMILKADKNNFTKFSFTYPADSGFVLIKENDKWKVDTSLADSAKVQQYFDGISYLNSTSFKDNFQETSPVMTLTIEGNNFSPATIRAFPADSVEKFIIHSSYNQSSYFIAGSEKLHERFFKPKKDFLPVVTSPPKQTNPAKQKRK